MQQIIRDERKYKAHTQKMCITYFKLEDNHIDFRVGVIGARKIPYILNFCQSTMNITCTCPDFEKREHKPLCKHMLFIVNLSNQKTMFNNLTSHNELKDALKLNNIRDSLMIIIDQKKMSSDLSESNTVSIERDDFCSICMCDLDVQIEKCNVCSHVMHILCITSWWDLSNSWNSNKGKCPYCKDPRGFAHIKNKDEDPWRNFDFDGAFEAQQAQEANQPILEPAPPAEEADQTVPESMLAEEAVQNVPEPLPAEEADQHVPEPLPAEEADPPIFDIIVGNPPFQNETINELRQTLLFINRFRNLNMNEQNLDAFLVSLVQEHDAIQNAFQAQSE